MGEGEGENRAEMAARNAIESPLMSVPLEGATGILMNVSTGTEITLREMYDAAKIIEETADPEAQVIWGHVIDESLGEKVHVTLIATFPGNAKPKAQPTPISKLTGHAGNKDAAQQKIPSQTQPPVPPQPQKRSAYDRYRTNRAPQGNFEEAPLTNAEDDEKAFGGLPRTTYDRPSYFRRSGKN